MPAADRKLRVFLCHASQDKPIVRELYQRLFAEGWIDPWLDEEKLLPGQDWDIEIEKAVEAADAVIVCLSNNSVTKEGYVQRELRFVLNIALTKPEDMIYVIPLRLEECQPPRRLRAWHYADYFPNERKKHEVERLLQALKLRYQQQSRGEEQHIPVDDNQVKDQETLLLGQMSFHKKTEAEESDNKDKDQPFLPLIGEYSLSFSNPSISFSDQELRRGSVRKNLNGMPLLWAGAFSVVFRVDTIVGSKAVRCFTSQTADIQDRYKHFYEHIRGKLLPMFVNWDYQSQGILVNGRWYPIIKMEWISGKNLTDYIEELIKSKNQKALYILSEQWFELIRGLQNNQIAHGDLSHENILVSSGSLRLVDYDSVFVPSLAGRNSIHLGHRNYQHPSRKFSDFYLGIDNFSALVIYLSIKALAFDLTLWLRYHNDENLLFSSSDFKTSDKSGIFAALKSSADDNIRDLALVLEKSCSLPMESVPTLTSIV